MITSGAAKSSGRPLLIHIGYHKTASTWLQKTVFQPEYGFFQPMELRELYDCLIRPNTFSFESQIARRVLEECLGSAVLGEGMVPVLSHERLCGDPFTGSRDAKEIANRLHDSFTEAKILIVVREQFQLIASLYKTYVLHGGKATLEEFIQPRCDEVNQWFDFRTYCYDRLINHYINLFGKENVLVVLYEELARNNAEFYERVSGFVGMAAGPFDPHRRETVNPSLSETGTEVQRWVNLAFDLFYPYPLQVSGNSIWRAVRSAIFRMERVTERFSARTRLKERTKNILSGNFRESNALLQTYVESDIGEFNYEL